MICEILFVWVMMRRMIRCVLTFSLLLTLSFAWTQASAQVCSQAVKGLVLGAEASKLSRHLLDKQSLEQLSYKIMRAVQRKSRDHEKESLEWLQSIKETQTEQPLTVLEHSALAYIFHSRIFESHSDPAAQNLLRNALMNSWKHLTGKEFPKSGRFPKLPRSVLLQAQDAAKDWHRAAFDVRDRPKFLFELQRNLKLSEKVKEKFERFSEQSPVSIKSGMITLVTLALAFHQFGRELLAGTLLGAVGASLNEDFVHVGIGHANEKLQKVFRKMSWVGRFAEEITLAHKIHHIKTTQDFSADFSSQKLKERIDKILIREARELVKARYAGRRISPEAREKEAQRVARDIRNAGYGVDGTLTGALAMHVTATPFIALNVLLYQHFGGEVFLGASMFSLSAFITQSLYSHRYLHMRDSAGDAAKTSLLMEWYMSTPVGKRQQRLHSEHHGAPMSPKETNNGVIMAFSLSDYIVRGGVKNPSIKTLLDLQKQGFLEKRVSR